MEFPIEIISGTIVASDPCYKIPTWCQGIIENVKKGTWLSAIDRTNQGEWGVRNASLTIIHKDNKDTDLTNLYLEVEPLGFTGSVDSGQFGFFDKDFYRNDESAKDLVKHDFGDDYDIEDGDQWYRACCNLTLNEVDGWGTLPNGVVSSSGFGDGSYDVFGLKNDEGEYIAFSVVFIWEDDEDEDDEDEDGE